MWLPANWMRGCKMHDLSWVDLAVASVLVLISVLISMRMRLGLTRKIGVAAVRTVYSHPQPLAQCGGWLRAHLPNAGLVPVESTAAAAQRAAQADQGHTAAIGHGKLADLMGLGILASRIEDEPGNWTRFVIIGPKDSGGQGGNKTQNPQPGHTGADKTSLLFTLPDKVSEAKRAVLRAYGAEVVVTPTDAGPDDPRSYYQVAERLANTIPGGFRPNQYDNPNGPLSHYYTTGPEIWEATDHKVTHFVAGIGTGGTISGTGKYLKEASNGTVKVIGSDPEGSIYSASSRDEVHQYDIEGAGEDFYPKAFDRNITDDIVRVSDAEAFEMTRRLAGEEALLVGGSSGMAVVSALKYAREHDLDSNQVVVVLLPDSGRSYLEKIFNDDWMRANGFADVVERTSKPSLAEQYL